MATVPIVRFPNPANAFQQNFNYLIGVDPNAAYNYALKGSNYDQLLSIMPESTYHQVVNSFSPGNGTTFSDGGSTYSTVGGTQFGIKSSGGSKLYQLPADTGSPVNPLALSILGASPQTIPYSGSTSTGGTTPTPTPTPSPSGGGNGGMTWDDVYQALWNQNPANAGKPYPGSPGTGTTPGTTTPGGGGSTGTLPGYGISQNLQGFGIPGFETKPMVGGGSWAGTTWSPPPAPTYSWGGSAPQTVAQQTAPITAPTTSLDTRKRIMMEGGGGDIGGGEGGDGSGGEATGSPGAGPGDTTAGNTATGNGGDGSSGSSGGTAQNNAGTTTSITLPDGTVVSGLTIRPAVPYETTDYRQGYPDTLAPWPNIHSQMGAAMRGVQPAMPGFNWASPQALSQLGGYGLPGGWTSMLGFTPGGNK